MAGFQLWMEWIYLLNAVVTSTMVSWFLIDLILCIQTTYVIWYHKDFVNAEEDISFPSCVFLVLGNVEHLSFLYATLSRLCLWPWPMMLCCSWCTTLFEVKSRISLVDYQLFGLVLCINNWFASYSIWEMQICNLQIWSTSRSSSTCFSPILIVLFLFS